MSIKGKYIVNNKTVISNYWKKVNNKSLARCYNAVLGGSFDNKLSSFIDALFVKNNENASFKDYDTSIVKLLFNTEIDFILKNIFKIIKEVKLVSFSSCELFAWMKKTDLSAYVNFKLTIQHYLKKLRIEEVKNKIAYIIYCFLFYDFIKL